MTVQKWLTPDGEWVNDGGLEPSIEVDFPDYAYLAPLPKDRIFKEGDEADSIETLNTFLGVLGYEVEGNQYTEATRVAVQEFQTKEELTVTGEVDAETALRIERAITEHLRETDQMYDKAVEVLTEE